MVLQVAVARDAEARTWHTLSSERVTVSLCSEDCVIDDTKGSTNGVHRRRTNTGGRGYIRGESLKWHMRGIYAVLTATTIIILFNLAVMAVNLWFTTDESTLVNGPIYDTGKVIK